MIDEVHELSKTTLMLIATLKNILKNKNSKNKKKVIITSATLDVGLIKDYFSGIKNEVVEIEAPTYGVQVFYADMKSDNQLNLNENTVSHLKKIFNVI